MGPLGNLYSLQPRWAARPGGAGASQGHGACRHWAGFLALSVGSGEPGADFGHFWSLRGLATAVGAVIRRPPGPSPQCSTLSHVGLCWFLFRPPACVATSLWQDRSATKELPLLCPGPWIIQSSITSTGSLGVDREGSRSRATWSPLSICWLELFQVARVQADTLAGQLNSESGLHCADGCWYLMCFWVILWQVRMQQVPRPTIP